MTPRVLTLIFLGILVVSCRSTARRPAVVEPAPQVQALEFGLHVERETGVEVTLPISGVRLRVDGEPVATAPDILAVSVAQLELGKCLLVELKAATVERLRTSESWRGSRRIVLLVEGQPLASRRLAEVPADGRLYLLAELPDADLPAVAARLNAAVVRRAMPTGPALDSRGT